MQIINIQVCTCNLYLSFRFNICILQKVEITRFEAFYVNALTPTLTFMLRLVFRFCFFYSKGLCHSISIFKISEALNTCSNTILGIISRQMEINIEA